MLLAEEWSALLASRLPTLAAGDLKDKHSSQNSQTNNVYGRPLSRYVFDDLNILVIGPTFPTYFYHQRHAPDYLAIITKHMAHNIEVSAVVDLSYDHYSLFIAVRALLALHRLPERPGKRVNWHSYHDEFSRQCYNTYRILLLLVADIYNTCSAMAPYTRSSRKKRNSCVFQIICIVFN